MVYLSKRLVSQVDRTDGGRQRVALLSTRSVYETGLAEPFKCQLALDHGLVRKPEPPLGFGQPRLSLGHSRPRRLDTPVMLVRTCHSAGAPWLGAGDLPALFRAPVAPDPTPDSPPGATHVRTRVYAALLTVTRRPGALAPARFSPHRNRPTGIW
jgi:hypothetical protein